MNTTFELLTEKEVLWAQMLMQVLNDNDIPCTAQPVHGAGLTTYTGLQERLKIYVPKESLEMANDLLQQLFSSEYSEE